MEAVVMPFSKLVRVPLLVSYPLSGVFGKP
jgi:hypothetical protein